MKPYLFFEQTFKVIFIAFTKNTGDYMKHIIFPAILIFFGISCLAQTQKKKYNTVYTDKNVDILPSYPGGEYELFQFIQEKFRVNSLMEETATSELNMFAVNFIVDTSGNLNDIQFYKSTNTYVEKEIRRIIAGMPKWKPAIKDGKNTVSRIYIPIKYKINNNEFQILNQGPELFVVHRKKNFLLKTIIVLGCLTFFLIKFF
jgi:hypothetical protein